MIDLQDNIIMDALRKNLTAQSSLRFLSVGDLIVGQLYPITRMENRDTQYGMIVHCVLEAGGEDGGLLEVYSYPDP